MAMKAFSPQTLRGILIVVLIAIIAGGAGLFYTNLNDIRQFAIEVNHSVADADASTSQVQALQTLKGQAAQNDSLITKTNQIFAVATNYQNQASADIRNYAAAAGLKVTQINFEEPVAGTTNPIAVVSLKSPVSYNGLIQFLNAIEGNIPKMLVTNIGISHVDGGSADSVNVDDIKIMIAAK